MDDDCGRFVTIRETFFGIFFVFFGFVIIRISDVVNRIWISTSTGKNKFEKKVSFKIFYHTSINILNSQFSIFFCLHKVTGPRAMQIAV